MLRENDEDVTLWRFLHPSKEPETVRIHPTMCSNDGAVVREWAITGQGVAIRSEGTPLSCSRPGLVSHEMCLEHAAQQHLGLVEQRKSLLHQRL